VLPYWRLKMDARLMTMLAAVALVTTGLFSVGPALYASRRGNVEGLKDGGRLTASPKARRWTHALLVGQFALTLALLHGTGLAAKTFYEFYALDRGVQTSDAITTFLRLPPEKYPTPDQRVAFHELLRARLMAVPGVAASTIASAPPFMGAGSRRLTAVDGQPVSDPPPNVMTLVVGSAYFRTVVSGLLLGESFTEAHGTPGHEAAIVNQRFAQVYLGSGSPIGRHLQLRSVGPGGPNLRLELRPPSPQATLPAPVTIVGVSPDIRQGQGDAVPIVYLPFRAETPAGVALIVRGSGGAAHIVSATRDAADAIDPDLALGMVQTMDELRDRSRLPVTGTTSQVGEIGGLALVFSAVGLYSAMAFSMRRRTQEIAVRMALGASTRDVRWLFLGTSARVVLGGLVMGVPASLAVGRLLQSNVLRADPRDLVTLVVPGVILAAVALVATVIPARRATRLDPTSALRIE